MKKALLIVIVTIAPLFASASPWVEGRHTTVGHRGTTILEDENTIAAFRSAYEHGLDVFECDPRLTKDGVYVIMHDSTVDRTTDGTGKVSDMTLEEIKQLRTENGHQVPTLEEALRFAGEHNMGVYLDLKEPTSEGAELLIKTIEETGMTHMVIAGCYELKTLRMIEKREPRISTCVSWPYPAATLGTAKLLGADAVGTLKGLASKPAVMAAHLWGLKIITMPINSSEMLDKFSKREVDGLQSDDPRLLEQYGEKVTH